LIVACIPGLVKLAARRGAKKMNAELIPEESAGARQKKANRQSGSLFVKLL
jgi:hypothetical protein